MTALRRRVEALEAALEFLVGGDPPWECSHGVPLYEFCSKDCAANVVRDARAYAKGKK